MTKDAPARGTGMPAPESPSPWSGLSQTQRAIVLALLRRGRMTRTEIMGAVGISPGSVTRLTAPLIEAGLLATSTEQIAATGRPQSPLEVNAAAESVIGITLSPHSLTAVLTDLRLGVLASCRRELGEHSPGAVADAVASAVEELHRSAAAVGPGSPRSTPPRASAIGIALGGTSHDGRTVDEAVFYGWHATPLARLVEERTGTPTVIDNDLSALTLSEAWFGAGAEHERFCVITVGAGVGYGLVVGGELVTTADAELGLLGALPVSDDARPMGAAPAMECLTSSAIERGWETRGRDAAPAARIEELAATGDADAVTVCATFARRLGRLIGTAAAFSLPEAVVVAGERAGIASLLEDQVMVGIAQVRRPSAAPIPLVIREHDRADWARGAAALALRDRVTGML